jgi:LysR family transcriptional regulator, nitrogen assimilation regulatory protein
MNLSTLKVFSRVAALGSFSKGAAFLGLTQPSVSHTIRELEIDLGAPLFHRTGRGVVLTEIGESALSRAESLLLAADQFKADIRTMSGQPKGEVTIGVLPTMSQFLAAPLFNRLAETAPEIKLRFREGFSDQIERWLADGGVDIGLLNTYRVPAEGKADVLIRSRLLMVGASRSGLLPSEISFSRLSEFNLVLPAIGNRLRDSVEDVARRKGMKLKIVAEAESLQIQMELVRQSDLFSVAAQEAVSTLADRKNLSVSIIRRPAISRYAIMKTTQQRPLSLAGRQAMQTIRTLIPKGRASPLQN